MTKLPPAPSTTPFVSPCRRPRRLSLLRHRTGRLPIPARQFPWACGYDSKASFDVSGYSATNQVILNAMKQYGMILADNGSAIYFTGTPDSRWNNDDLHLLTQVTAADFEVVQMSTVYTSSNVPQGSAPSISGLSASSSTVAAGSPVTLSWNATNASYLYISPVVGPVRGSSVTFSPAASATYTLTATNEYGRTTATVTVNVQ